MKKYIKLFEEFQEQLEGGEADGMQPSDFDKKELILGIFVEKEHSDDKNIKMEIAMDHLAENPTYYSDSAKQGVYKDEPDVLTLYQKLFNDDPYQYEPNKQD